MESLQSDRAAFRGCCRECTAFPSKTAKVKTQNTGSVSLIMIGTTLKIDTAPPPAKSGLWV